jgi:hypothetical protein
MKTAMQDMIEWIEQRFNNPQETEVFKKATELLEKEKEQILEAVKFGQNNHTEWIPEDEMIAKNYFNDKYEVVEEFNQNK